MNHIGRIQVCRVDPQDLNPADFLQVFGGFAEVAAFAVAGFSVEVGRQGEDRA
ncbi:hypothetical protein ACWDKQ_18710 [Saccharopolyspora sp. NPDC000995]